MKPLNQYIGMCLKKYPNDMRKAVACGKPKKAEHMKLIARKRELGCPKMTGKMAGMFS